MESIANKIRKALERKKMTQSFLANSINYSDGNFSNLLKRDTYNTNTLEKIANVMGYDLKIVFVDKETGENY